jgi:hypothetical protein
MEEYEYVITDSVGLTEAELDSFRGGIRSNTIGGAVGNGADEFIGASIQVETKIGAVVGKFSYYVERSNGR